MILRNTSRTRHTPHPRARAGWPFSSHATPTCPRRMAVLVTRHTHVPTQDGHSRAQRSTRCCRDSLGHGLCGSTRCTCITQAPPITQAPLFGHLLSASTMWSRAAEDREWRTAAQRTRSTPRCVWKSGRCRSTDPEAVCTWKPSIASPARCVIGSRSDAVQVPWKRARGQKHDT